MPEISVVKQDGTEYILPHVGHEIEERDDRMWNATALTTRSAARDATFDPADDYATLRLEDERDFGGVLRDVDVGSEHARLVVDSFERLAADAEPTGAGVRWQGVTDGAVITSAVADVPDLTQGNIEYLKSGLSFLFSHSTQAKRIRTIVDATGGSVRYNADRTVDYADSFGERRDVIVAPSNRRLVDGVTVDRKGGEDRATHLRMLGAGEGRHQKSAVVVDPEYDPSTDREKWRVYSNKDFTDEDTLREHGRELIEEFSEEWVEASATLRNLDPPTLGDSFHVEHPESGLNRRLYVTRIVRKSDDDGRRYDVDLSSRQMTGQHSGQKARSDVERFNKSVQGVAVPINAGGGRQPVNAQSNYYWEFYYPSEVEYEHRLNIRVIGMPYRAYSAGGASGGDHTHAVDVTHPSHDHSVSVTHPSHRHSVSTTSADNADFADTVQAATDLGAVTINDTWTTVDTFSPGAGSDISQTLVAANFALQEPDELSTYWRLLTPAGAYIPDSTGYHAWAPISSNTDVYNSVSFLQNTDISGQTLELQARAAQTRQFAVSTMFLAAGSHTHGVSDTSSAELGTTETATSSAELGTTATETSAASGPHTHDPEPGIIEDFGGVTHYPENCDVVINGASQGTAFGDGTGRFAESVDVRGELTPGAVNIIEVTSGSLGHMMAFAEGDTFRMILGDG